MKLQACGELWTHPEDITCQVPGRLGEENIWVLGKRNGQLGIVRFPSGVASKALRKDVSMRAEAGADHFENDEGSSPVARNDDVVKEEEFQDRYVVEQEQEEHGEWKDGSSRGLVDDKRRSNPQEDEKKKSCRMMPRKVDLDRKESAKDGAAFMELEMCNEGHDGEITCMTFAANFSSSDASAMHDLVISGSSDRKVKVWRVKYAAGKIDMANIQTLVGHGGTITAVCTGGGSKSLRVITASTDKTIRIWIPETGRGTLLLYPWLGLSQTIRHSTWFTSLEVGVVQRQLDLPTIFAGDSKGALSIFRPDNNSSLSHEEHHDGFEESKRSGVPPRSSSSSKSRSGSERGEQGPRYNENSVERFKLHSLGIARLLMIDQQNVLVTVGNDNCIRVFDVVGKSPFLTITNKRRCRYLWTSWDSINHELLATDEKGHVEMWNIYTDRCLLSQRLPQGVDKETSMQRDWRESKRDRDEQHSVPGWEELLTCNYVSLEQDAAFNVTMGPYMRTFRLRRSLAYNEYKGHSASVISITCDQTFAASRESMEGPMPTRRRPSRHDDDNSDEDGSQGKASRSASSIMSASIDNSLRGWDWYDMSCLFSLREPESEISSAVKLPESNLLITGNQDGTLRFWSCDSGSTLVLQAHENTVSSLAIAYRRKSTYLLTASYDGYVGVWDVTKRHVLKPRLEHKIKAHGRKEDEEGRKEERKFTTVDDGLARLLQEDAEQEILCICYSPGCERPADTSEGDMARPDTFFTGGNDCVIRQWMFGTFGQVSTLEGHEDAVTCIQVDGNFVISGSEDKTIRIWDLTILKEPMQINVIRAHTQSVQGLVVLNSNLACNLASCSRDGTIKLWDYTRLDHGDDIEEDMERGDEDYRSVSGSSSRSEETSQRSDSLLCEFSNPNLHFTCVNYCECRNELLTGTEEGLIIGYSLESFSL